MTGVTITLDRQILDRIDRLVADRIFPSRSRLIQDAARARIARFDRLGIECAKLGSRSEQELAESGASHDLDSWPEY